MSNDKRYIKCFTLTAHAPISYLDSLVLSYIHYQNQYQVKPKVATIAQLLRVSVDTVGRVLYRLKDAGLYDGNAVPQNHPEYFVSANGSFAYFKVLLPSGKSQLDIWDCLVWSFIRSCKGKPVNNSYVAKVMHRDRKTIRRTMSRLLKFNLLVAGAVLPKDKEDWFLNVGQIDVSEAVDRELDEAYRQDAVKVDEPATVKIPPNALMKQAEARIEEVLAEQPASQMEILDVYRPLAYLGIDYDYVHSVCNRYLKPPYRDAVLYKEAVINFIGRQLKGTD